MDEDVTRDEKKEQSAERRGFSSNEQLDLLASGEFRKTGRSALNFSLMVHRELEEEVLSPERMPLVYVGSGGDWISAWLASGSDRILLVDKAPFLLEEGTPTEPKSTYRTFDEAWASHYRNDHSSGNFTYFDRVRPAAQLARDLRRLGLSREDVTVEQASSSSEIEISFALKGRQVRISYSSCEVRKPEDIRDLLNEHQIDAVGGFGIMAKGGGGNLISELLQRWNSEQPPTYCITDDPDAYRDQRPIAEKFPGYQTKDIKVDSTLPVSWGWCREGADYSARAIIGVKMS